MVNEDINNFAEDANRPKIVQPNAEVTESNNNLSIPMTSENKISYAVFITLTTAYAYTVSFTYEASYLGYFGFAATTIPLDARLILTTVAGLGAVYFFVAYLFTLVQTQTLSTEKVLGYLMRKYFLFAIIILGPLILAQVDQWWIALIILGFSYCLIWCHPYLEKRRMPVLILRDC